MKQSERTLFYLASLLLFAAGVLSFAVADAQSLTMPAYVNPDPVFWYQQYQAEHLRAEGLSRSGATAISGLTASLKAANDTITGQNQIIVTLAGDRDKQTSRANVAEAALKPVTDERDKLKGRTWAGRIIRKARDPLAVVGGLLLIFKFLP